MSIRVLVVDDHAVVRIGLQKLLSGWPDIEWVGSAENGLQSLQHARELLPDVVLMDLRMPTMDGVQATAAIRDVLPEVKVVVLTSMGDEDNIVRALAAGADGFLFKHAEPDEIAHAIRVAADGGAVLDPRAAQALLKRTRASQAAGALSDRETEVLEFVREGLANKQIARRLGIADRTVKAHLTSIFRRLGVTDRTQAALWAQENLP